MEKRASIDRFFHLSERDSSLSREVIGGLTTFLAMAYIIAVNPQILASAGVPYTAAMTATCFGAAIMTAVMGVFANRPIALASGMGINSIIAFTLCAGELSFDWRAAMSIVLIEGIVILLLVLCGLRQAVMDAIPPSLRHAIGIGIGLFIALIGLKGGGLVVGDASTLLTFGDVTSPQCIVAIISIACAIVLHAMGVHGDLLISIIFATLVGIPLGVTPVPESLSFTLDFSGFAAPFQTVPGTDQMAIVRCLLQPVTFLFVFSMLMSDFFDTMGIMVAVGQNAGFADEKGNVEDSRRILLVDSIAAAVGGFVGASSITAFAESTSGAAAGARTGLSNLVVAALFALSAFAAPFVSMVGGAATCGALVVVGYLMLSDVVSIDWGHVELAFPSFLVIVGVPFAYSITDGIGMGFIAYCLLMVARGRIREVKPLMWIVSVGFVVVFMFT